MQRVHWEDMYPQVQGITHTPCSRCQLMQQPEPPRGPWATCAAPVGAVPGCCPDVGLPWGCFCGKGLP